MGPLSPLYISTNQAPPVITSLYSISHTFQKPIHTEIEWFSLATFIAYAEYSSIFFLNTVTCKYQVLSTVPTIIHKFTTSILLYLIHTTRLCCKSWAVLLSATEKLNANHANHDRTLTELFAKRRYNIARMI